MSTRPTLLAKAAAAAGACALLIGAAAALGQDYRHDHDGQSGHGEQHSGSWNGRGGDRGNDRGGYRSENRSGPWTGRSGAPPMIERGRPGVARTAPGAPPGRWDQRRYNGYWSGGRWFFGAPQAPARRQPDYRPGFVPWRRGAYLPPQYQSYAVQDYWSFHLRRPPYGYEWVEVGDEFLLISVATGMIFDVIEGG